jgi:carbon storage regulator
MLVITRKKNESITIGDNITVTVVEICDGHKVKLGIEAPKGVMIDRPDAKCHKPKDRGTA